MLFVKHLLLSTANVVVQYLKDSVCCALCNGYCFTLSIADYHVCYLKMCFIAQYLRIVYISRANVVSCYLRIFCCVTSCERYCIVTHYPE